ncbi:TetR/AcrR family transcriptional regulator, partial [Streptomyces sp. NPDC059569]|uniref:TetR/AcrR family transcriptional regulator n=1 Tax=Streptomyces sp. NPDC059569 TaxID=3346869 RepID=UPI00368B6E53
FFLFRHRSVTAAGAVLLAPGGDRAVRWGGNAPTVGIAPPSIYAHFDTPDQIVEAVVTETRSLLVRHLETARAGADGARERLLADCHAYLVFGAEQPELYALLFSRPRPRGSSTTEERIDQAVRQLAPIVGEPIASQLAPAEAFSILLRDVADAMRDGTSRAEDALATATALWAALHGLILLRARIPRFPWPPPGPLEDEIISRLAYLHDPAPR